MKHWRYPVMRDEHECIFSQYREKIINHWHSPMREYNECLLDLLLSLTVDAIWHCLSCPSTDIYTSVQSIISGADISPCRKDKLFRIVFLDFFFFLSLVLHQRSCSNDIIHFFLLTTCPKMWIIFSRCWIFTCHKSTEEHEHTKAWQYKTFC